VGLGESEPQSEVVLRSGNHEVVPHAQRLQVWKFALAERCQGRDSGRRAIFDALDLRRGLFLIAFPLLGADARAA